MSSAFRNQRDALIEARARELTAAADLQHQPQHQHRHQHRRQHPPPHQGQSAAVAGHGGRRPGSPSWSLFTAPVQAVSLSPGAEQRRQQLMHQYRMSQTHEEHLALQAAAADRRHHDDMMPGPRDFAGGMPAPQVPPPLPPAPPPPLPPAPPSVNPSAVLMERIRSRLRIALVRERTRLRTQVARQPRPYKTGYGGRPAALEDVPRVAAVDSRSLLGASNWGHLFRSFDTNSDGELSLREFCRALREGCGLPATILPDATLRALFNTIDLDHSVRPHLLRLFCVTRTASRIVTHTHLLSFFFACADRVVLTRRNFPRGWKETTSSLATSTRIASARASVQPASLCPAWRTG